MPTEVEQLRDLARTYWSKKPVMCPKHPGVEMTGTFVQTTFADVLSADQALYAAQLTVAERRQALWLAVADLQGLMQLDIDEEFSGGS